MRFGWVGLGLLACSGDEGGTSPTGETAADSGDTEVPGTPPCDLPLAVTPGTGQSTYQALTEGGSIQVTWGPQGGWHLWTAGEVTGLHGSAITILGHAQVVSTGQVFSGEFTAPVTIDAAVPGIGTWQPGICTGTFWGQFAYVEGKGEGSDFACNLDGQEIDFTVDVTDVSTGETTSSTVRVLGARDPNPDNPCNG